jgi:hypothetical protein
VPLGALKKALQWRYIFLGKGRNVSDKMDFPSSFWTDCRIKVLNYLAVPGSSGEMPAGIGEMRAVIPSSDSMIDYGGIAD